MSRGDFTEKDARALVVLGLTKRLHEIVPSLLGWWPEVEEWDGTTDGTMIRVRFRKTGSSGYVSVSVFVAVLLEDEIATLEPKP